MTGVSPWCGPRTAVNRNGRVAACCVRSGKASNRSMTFKGQLDLEQHGGRSMTGVAVRVLQRVLALTAAIWHNWRTGQPIMRSLTAYDH